MYDVVIIGGGVIGAFVARNIAKYELRTIVLEKEADVCCGATRANSAIVHSGYSGKPGSLKSKLTVDANADFAHVCQELDVEYKQIGSLMMAVDERGMEKVYEKYQRGLKNQVPGLQILNKEEALALEPHLNPKVTIAMYAPTTGIVNPWEFGIAAMENAMDNGVELQCNTKVQGIHKVEDGTYEIQTNQGRFKTKYLFNCGGLYADEIHNLIGEPAFRIAPRKGEYILLDKQEANHKVVNHVIFQARDNDDAKGVIIVPTVHDNVLVGPTAVDVAWKGETSVSVEALSYIKKVSTKSIVDLPFSKQIRSFAGVRPRPQLLTGVDPETGEVQYGEDKVKDFIIGPIDTHPHIINCAGMKSPGLTCANEVGKYAVALLCKQLKEEEIQVTENLSYTPKRRPLYRLAEKSVEEQQAYIQENSLLGNVVCRCNHITEGEIRDVIHRNCGATTVDGVKRRAGTGMGRCQGGFCTIAITKILHQELGIPYTEIEKDSKESYLLSE